MNNEQFRKLLLANSANAPAANDATPKGAATPSAGNSLGSRQRSSIPMTPRSVAGAQANFARQLAERNQTDRPQKKFRTYAPKGAKLASGYVDRAKEREDEEADDRAERLKALEELLKNEEIDQTTFEKLRFEIAGGDLESTHLVKGLDFKLLERIRKGDNVYEEKEPKVEPAEDPEPEQDVDDEFDQLEGKEVEALEKDNAEKKKKGQLSVVPLAGKKRTRDQILAELRASREAAKAKQESALGGRFQKIGAKQMPGTRIERDHKGREVMIIVDEDGHEKRKIRKIQPGAALEAEDEPAMPNKDAKPLGMEVPEQYKKKEEPEEEEDVDIFDDVGDDYDPLAGLAGSDSETEDGGKADEDAKPPTDAESGESSAGKMLPPPKPAAPHNYFKDSKTGLVSAEASRAPNMADPAIMAAIKKAAALNPISRGEQGDEEDKEAKALKEKRRKMLHSSDRDDDDLDMGFGTSRFEDEEDFEDKKMKLSVWGKDDGDEGESGGGPAKRKRGPKKRKGDANNADDVLRVMEQRKKA